MGKYEDLKLLDELREKGSITEEEYQREKAKILNGTPPPPPFSSDDRLYVVVMHLTQFVSAFIIPLIMWLIGKDRSLVIDQHGKNIINFFISYLIYAIILAVTCIGIPLLIVLIVFVIPIFIIIATIKAANGEAWKYPLSVEFIT